MRSRLNILVAAAAMVMVIPQLAMADSVEEQLRLMNERMEQMEGQLQATQDDLEASQEKVERQESVIQKAGLEDRSSKSGLAGFFEQVNVSGWIAASYVYNLNRPSSSVISGQNFSGVAEDGDHWPINGGINAFVAPFHPDHNSFSVDQLMFEIEKPVTEESRAGFRADMLYGKTAGIMGYGTQRLCGGQNVRRELGDDNDIDFDVSIPTDVSECTGDSASDFNLYQAYVQYLTTFGPTVKLGKFATWTGSEELGQPYNYNITRGLLYSVMQPINHYGVTLDGQTDGGIIYGIGAVNSFQGVDPDFNGSKTLMTKLGWAGETVSTQATLLFGEEKYGNNSGNVGLLDLTANWNPTESFGAWVNFDYGWASSNRSGWGIAAAGRYAFTERFGFALRGEYVRDNLKDDGLSLFSAIDNAESPIGIGMWSMTGTLDYLLTDNLTVRGEIRYDDYSRASGSGVENDFFVGHEFNSDTNDNDAFVRPDQFLGLIEVIYQF